MKTLLISYSLTGNNEALADSLAIELSAKRMKITEPGTRTMGKIVLDIMFNRSPKIEQKIDGIGMYDLVLFVGPVWMGHVATPFRGCFDRLKGKSCDYGFISISGGADGPNPTLKDDLTKRVGKAPKALIDLHIADLLPPDPKPTRKDTMGYRLNDRNVSALCDAAVMGLNESIGPENTGERGEILQDLQIRAVRSSERRGI